MTTRIVPFLVAGLTFLTALPLSGGEKGEHGFLRRLYKGPDGESKYVVFVPPDYNGDKPYPAILFLHGAGERGSDGERQVQVGLGKAIRDRHEKFPFIAVFPQALKTWKAGSPDADRALAILAEVEKQYKIDPERVYLTGLSMGGFGTWGLAALQPQRWAAIVPICGGGDPSTADKIKDIPCWCFQGADDKAVPAQRSRDMIEALKKAGGMPRYSEFPYVGHNSWDPAYATGELYSWLRAQKRK